MHKKMRAHVTLSSVKGCCRVCVYVCVFGLESPFGKVE